MLKNEEKAFQTCTGRRYEVHYSDLPLSCPPKDVGVWDAHPRVYLPIEETGQVLCPYCSTTYLLKDFVEPERPLILNPEIE